MKKLTPEDFNSEAKKFEDLIKKIVKNSQEMEKIFYSFKGKPSEEKIVEILEHYEESRQTYQDISLVAANLALILSIMRNDLKEMLL